METWWEHGGKHGDFMDFLKKERERDIYIYVTYVFFLARPYDMFDVEVLVKCKALLDSSVVVGIQFHSLDTKYLQ